MTTAQKLVATRANFLSVVASGTYSAIASATYDES